MNASSNGCLFLIIVCLICGSQVVDADNSELLRNALSDLYTATGGETWALPPGGVHWGAPEDPCGWAGVVCCSAASLANMTILSYTAAEVTRPCSRNGALTALLLRGVGMAGTLPYSFSDLLPEVLVLADNPDLKGQLPPALLLLDRLVEVDIRNTSLSCSSGSMHSSSDDLSIDGNLNATDDVKQQQQQQQQLTGLACEVPVRLLASRASITYVAGARALSSTAPAVLQPEGAIYSCPALLYRPRVGNSSGNGTGPTVDSDVPFLTGVDGASGGGTVSVQEDPLSYLPSLVQLAPHGSAVVLADPTFWRFQDCVCLQLPGSVPAAVGPPVLALAAAGVGDEARVLATCRSANAVAGGPSGCATADALDAGSRKAEMSLESVTLAGIVVGTAAATALLTSLAIAACCMRQELRRRRAIAAAAAKAATWSRSRVSEDPSRHSYHHRPHSPCSGAAAAAAAAGPAAAAAVGWRSVLRDWILGVGNQPFLICEHTGSGQARVNSGGTGTWGTRLSIDSSHPVASSMGPRKNAPPGGNLFHAKRSRPPGSAPETFGSEVTLVATDVEGSTELWEWQPDVMNHALTLHDRMVRLTLAACCGYEVTTEGDAFLVAFHDPVDAVRWALLLQSALLKLDWPPLLLEHPLCRPRPLVPTATAADTQQPGDGPDADDPTAVPLLVLFKGLSVRMGIATGVPSALREHPVTRRMQYTGAVLRLATGIAELGSGGQILLEPLTFKGIHNKFEELDVVESEVQELADLIRVQYVDEAKVDLFDGSPIPTHATLPSTIAASIPPSSTAAINVALPSVSTTNIILAPVPPVPPSQSQHNPSQSLSPVAQHSQPLPSMQLQAVQPLQSLQRPSNRSTRQIPLLSSDGGQPTQASDTSACDKVSPPYQTSQPLTAAFASSANPSTASRPPRRYGNIRRGESAALLGQHDSCHRRPPPKQASSRNVTTVQQGPTSRRVIGGSSCRPMGLSPQPQGLAMISRSAWEAAAAGSATTVAIPIPSPSIAGASHGQLPLFGAASGLGPSLAYVPELAQYSPTSEHAAQRPTTLPHHAVLQAVDARDSGGDIIVSTANITGTAGVSGQFLDTMLRSGHSLGLRGPVAVAVYDSSSRAGPSTMSGTFSFQSLLPDGSGGGVLKSRSALSQLIPLQMLQQAASCEVGPGSAAPATIPMHVNPSSDMAGATCRHLQNSVGISGSSPTARTGRMPQDPAGVLLEPPWQHMSYETNLMMSELGSPITPGIASAASTAPAGVAMAGGGCHREHAIQDPLSPVDSETVLQPPKPLGRSITRVPLEFVERVAGDRNPSDVAATAAPAAVHSEGGGNDGHSGEYPNSPSKPVFNSLMLSLPSMSLLRGTGHGLVVPDPSTAVATADVSTTVVATGLSLDSPNDKASAAVPVMAEEAPIAAPYHAGLGASQVVRFSPGPIAEAIEQGDGAWEIRTSEDDGGPREPSSTDAEGCGRGSVTGPSAAAPTEGPGTSSLVQSSPHGPFPGDWSHQYTHANSSRQHLSPASAACVRIPASPLRLGAEAGSFAATALRVELLASSAASSRPPQVPPTCNGVGFQQATVAGVGAIAAAACDPRSANGGGSAQSGNLEAIDAGSGGRGSETSIRYMGGVSNERMIRRQPSHGAGSGAHHHHHQHHHQLHRLASMSTASCPPVETSPSVPSASMAAAAAAMAITGGAFGSATQSGSAGSSTGGRSISGSGIQSSSALPGSPNIGTVQRHSTTLPPSRQPPSSPPLRQLPSSPSSRQPPSSPPSRQPLHLQCFQQHRQGLPYGVVKGSMPRSVGQLHLPWWMEGTAPVAMRGDRASLDLPPPPPSHHHHHQEQERPQGDQSDHVEPLLFVAGGSTGGSTTGVAGFQARSISPQVSAAHPIQVTHFASNSSTATHLQADGWRSAFAPGSGITAATDATATGIATGPAASVAWIGGAALTTASLQWVRSTTNGIERSCKITQHHPHPPHRPSHTQYQGSQYQQQQQQQHMSALQLSSLALLSPSSNGPALDPPGYGGGGGAGGSVEGDLFHGGAEVMTEEGLVGTFPQGGLETTWQRSDTELGNMYGAIGEYDALGVSYSTGRDPYERHRGSVVPIARPSMRVLLEAANTSVGRLSTGDCAIPAAAVSGPRLLALRSTMGLQAMGSNANRAAKEALDLSNADGADSDDAVGGGTGPVGQDGGTSAAPQGAGGRASHPRSRSFKNTRYLRDHNRAQIPRVGAGGASSSRSLLAGLFHRLPSATIRGGLELLGRNRRGMPRASDLGNDAQVSRNGGDASAAVSALRAEVTTGAGSDGAVMATAPAVALAALESSARSGPELITAAGASGSAGDKAGGGLEISVAAMTELATAAKKHAAASRMEVVDEETPRSAASCADSPGPKDRGSKRDFINSVSARRAAGPPVSAATAATTGGADTSARSLSRLRFLGGSGSTAASAAVTKSATIAATQSPLSGPPRGTSHSLIVIDMGVHRLKISALGPAYGDLYDGVQVIQIVPEHLKHRAAYQPPLKSQAQLSPSFFDAPGAAQALLPCAPRQAPSFPRLSLMFIQPGGYSAVAIASPAVAERSGAVFAAAVREVLQVFGAYECQEYECTFMVACASPRIAAEAALTLHESLLHADWPTDLVEEHPEGRLLLAPDGRPLLRGFRAKVGIFTGVPLSVVPHATTGRADYFGALVNRAARLMAGAKAGQTLLDKPAGIEVLKEWRQMAAKLAASPLSSPCRPNGARARGEEALGYRSPSMRCRTRTEYKPSSRAVGTSGTRTMSGGIPAASVVSVTSTSGPATVALATESIPALDLALRLRSSPQLQIAHPNDEYGREEDGGYAELFANGAGKIGPSLPVVTTRSPSTGAPSLQPFTSTSASLSTLPGPLPGRGLEIRSSDVTSRTSSGPPPLLAPQLEAATPCIAAGDDVLADWVEPGVAAAGAMRTGASGISMGTFELESISQSNARPPGFRTSPSLGPMLAVLPVQALPAVAPSSQVQLQAAAAPPILPMRQAGSPTIVSTANNALGLQKEQTWMGLRGNCGNGLAAARHTAPDVVQVYDLGLFRLKGLSEGQPVVAVQLKRLKVVPVAGADGGTASVAPSVAAEEVAARAGGGPDDVAAVGEARGNSGGSGAPGTAAGGRGGGGGGGGGDGKAEQCRTAAYKPNARVTLHLESGLSWAHKEYSRVECRTGGSWP
ncbi:hypothetical protein VaNZ11_001174 [Volvox africanus]|uniref:Guanylate cyclase domain-containing protein n=1 Tax=Volvox africanus TaxID=51714 RepID=A0ABQ5RP80_9CHLO|nr:hypothetical protein VaNZ11_001174 [Volvox africanus]